MVREGGLEPPHPYGHRNLNPARLPIPPLARADRQGIAGGRWIVHREPACTKRAPVRWVGLGVVGTRGFERRLERVVEGTFSRLFRSGVRPVELGRRLVREMDDRRSIGVTGRTVAPNSFTFTLREQDHTELAQIHDTLVRELCEAAREHARDESYGFLGPVRVELLADPAMRTGAFTLQARLVEAEGGAAVGTLVLPSGERLVLGEYVVTIGRLPDSTLSLADANVSRNHAEIRPRGAGYVVVDLGSTNGTKVNGAPITERALADGDVVTFGSTDIRFDES
jgi:hypothetical protein